VGWSEKFHNCSVSSEYRFRNECVLVARSRKGDIICPCTIKSITSVAIKVRRENE